MDKMKTQHNKEINELREKIDRLEHKNGWNLFKNDYVNIYMLGN
jgi:hypothetical protein